jgi:hypothetical protein
VLVAKDAASIGDIAKLIGKPVKTYKEKCSQIQFLGHEVLSEMLKWLRVELRYRNSSPYEDTRTSVSEIGNPQPSLYVHYDKDMRKVQRLNGDGSERLNQSQ